ncbi:MAG: hypothetical protein J7L57_06555 [Deltaproteobacteria bacterium]|nr:hypothetical protein [Candidatus Tharpella sp.]
MNENRRHYRSIKDGLPLEFVEKISRLIIATMPVKTATEMDQIVQQLTAEIHIQICLLISYPSFGDLTFDEEWLRLKRIEKNAKALIADIDFPNRANNPILFASSFSPNAKFWQQFPTYS